MAGNRGKGKVLSSDANQRRIHERGITASARRKVIDATGALGDVIEDPSQPTTSRVERDPFDDESDMESASYSDDDSNPEDPTYMIPPQPHIDEPISIPIPSHSHANDQVTYLAPHLICKMGEINTKRIIKYAITSRILVLTLIILWRSLLSPYDTSASLNPSCLSHSSQSSQSLKPPILFPFISSAIEDSIVWDSVYFLRIAQCGYEYEQYYAFFPLLPILIFLLSNSVLSPLIPVIGYRAVLGLSGYVINNVAFVFAALFLYRLSVVILKDPDAALRASTLFCFNPASIFYSSIYTESLYALLSIGGTYLLISGANNVPVLLFALSGFSRSNGVLNAGYYGFKALHQSCYALYARKHALLVLQVLLAGALRCICIFIPFLAFQAYGYYNICHGCNPDEMRPWCKARVPLLYGFIQSHYWGVGVFRYFQFKQLPNFLLASPVLSLALCSILSYSRADPENFFTLGFKVTLNGKSSTTLLFSGEEEQFKDDHHATKQEASNLRRRQKSKSQGAYVSPSVSQVSVEDGYHSAIVLPFIYHLTFMAATAFFVMHVQVATRFLSASPPLYWFVSYLMTSAGKSRLGAHLIWGYAASYILLGSLLFSNFYPFT